MVDDRFWFEWLDLDDEAAVLSDAGSAPDTAE